MWRRLFLVIHGICLFMLVVLAHISSVNINDVPNYFVRAVLLFLQQYKFWCAVTFAGYVFIYTIFPKWVFPWQAREKFLKEMISRINSELFEDNSLEHRVTLFRKTNWIVGGLINSWAILCNLCIRDFDRVRAHLRLYGFTDYLVIRKRCAVEFERSTTLFKVDRNRPERYGVAAYIVCTGFSPSIKDLPNINDIDFRNVEKIDDIPSQRRGDVRNYMEQAYIKDFQILRMVHKKARHYHGAILGRKDGSPWGVLLVDSYSNDSPFTPHVKTRFNSFARTVYGILNLEA